MWSSMSRYLLLGLVLLLCAVVEFGFLDGFGMTLAAMPICACIGVYYVFRLRPILGLTWIIGAGLLTDLHSIDAVGVTIIAVILGLAVVFVVESYISHVSVYSVFLVSLAFVLAWNVLTLFSSLIIGGVSYGGAVAAGLWASVLSGAFVAILVMLWPRVEMRVAKYFRTT